MADIKFECPECKQRIAVDETASGLEIDCPTCRSSLVIPATAGAVPKVLVHRKLAVDAGSIERTAAELTEAKSASEKLKEEVKALRAESEVSKNAAAELKRQLNAATEAKSDAKHSREELEAAQKRCVDLDSKLAASIAAMANHAALLRDLQSIRGELSARTEERDKLKTALETVKAGAKSKATSETAFVEKISALERERDALRAEIHQSRQLLEEGELWKLHTEEARAKVVTLTEQVTALNAERAALKGAGQQGEAELAAAKSAADSAKKVSDGFQEKLSALTAEAAAWEKERAALQRQINEPKPHPEFEEAKVELAKFQKEHAAATTTIKALQDGRDALQKQLADRESAINEATGALEAAKRATAEAMAARQGVQGQLEDALATVKGLNQRVGGLLDNLHARERSAGESSQTISALSGERDDLRAKLASRDAAAQAAANAADGLRAESEKVRAQLKAALAEAEAIKAGGEERAGDLQRRIEELESEIGGARNAMHIAVAERDEASGHFATKENAIRDLTNKLTQAGTTEHTLRLQLETAEKNVAMAAEKLKASEGERERLQVRFEATSSELETVTGQLKATKTERDAAKAIANSGEVALEKALDQIHSTESERDALRAELEATRAGLERTKQHVNAMQSRRDQMREEIAKLKVQLGLAPDAIG